MVKIIGGKLDEKEFKEWCKKNGRDCEHKLSIVEYSATVLKNEKVKEVFEKIKNGEVDIEQVKVVNFDEEADDDNEEKRHNVTDTNLKGLEDLMIGLIKFGHIEGEDKNNNEAIKKVEEDFKHFYETDNKLGLIVLFEQVMAHHGDKLLEVLKDVCTFLENGKKMCKFMNGLKEMFDDDKE